jgi:hypothetical protein
MEMLRDAYAQANEIAPGIFDRVFPLPTNLVRPLAKFIPPSAVPNDDVPAGDLKSGDEP